MSKTTISRKMLRPMSTDTIEKIARVDRDAQPLTSVDLKRMKQTRE